MSLGTLGALFAFLGVLAGAFGAHALRGRLTPELLQVFETGARYQLIHALGMIAAALAQERGGRPGLGLAGGLFAAGIVIFSGSLYALALTGIRGFGAITPIGGLCFLAGWLLLARALSRRA
jgi:uncharacterized membrane protein YgdD (TMEM256/DUF423 family)